VAAITEAAIRELAGFRGQDAPVTTCYLDVDGRRLSRHRDYQQELDRVIRSARVKANGTASVAQDLDRIESYVRGGFDRSTTRGLAMFSCSAHDFWKVVPLPVPVRSRVVINQAPAVSQLESVAQGFDRFGVLLVDKQRARMLVFQFGELIDRSELFDELPRDYDTRGHSDQGDVTAHVDAMAAAHVRHAAAVAFHVFQQEPFDHLTLGAPNGLASSVENALHPYLRERLCGRIDVGVNAGPAEIREAVLDVEREVERRREADAVARLRSQHASGNRAVIGAAATLQALVERRVEQLLVSADYSESGWHCPGCGHLGLVGRTCPGCGSELVPVEDIVEEAIDAALAQSCHVEVCVDNADLDVLGRIGALLRY
jgi:peptide subunit release factor 1 (eRF1)